MKNSLIIGIIMIIVSIIIIISYTNDFTEYQSFTDAEGRTGKVKIVGQLLKEKEVSYNPIKDPNYTSFHMIDRDSVAMEVIYLQPKPTDFERSEQVVVTGKIKENKFYASDVLTKCPSKYKDEEIAMKKTADI